MMPSNHNFYKPPLPKIGDPRTLKYFFLSLQQVDLSPYKLSSSPTASYSIPPKFDRVNLLLNRALDFAFMGDPQDEMDGGSFANLHMRRYAFLRFVKETIPPADQTPEFMDTCERLVDDVVRACADALLEMEHRQYYTLFCLSLLESNTLLGTKHTIGLFQPKREVMLQEGRKATIEGKVDPKNPTLTNGLHVPLPVPINFNADERIFEQGGLSAIFDKLVYAFFQHFGNPVVDFFYYLLPIIPKLIVKFYAAFWPDMNKVSIIKDEGKSEDDNEIFRLNFADPPISTPKMALTVLAKICVAVELAQGHKQYELKTANRHFRKEVYACGKAFGLEVTFVVPGNEKKPSRLPIGGPHSYATLSDEEAATKPPQVQYDEKKKPYALPYQEKEAEAYYSQLKAKDLRQFNPAQSAVASDSKSEAAEPDEPPLVELS